jgi:hypothetical protein
LAEANGNEKKKSSLGSLPSHYVADNDNQKDYRWLKPTAMKRKSQVLVHCRPIYEADRMAIKKGL